MPAMQALRVMANGWAWVVEFLPLNTRFSQVPIGTLIWLPGAAGREQPARVTVAVKVRSNIGPMSEVPVATS
ncbi:hypothetical protein D3C78_1545360 [compost metagenome]